MLLIRTDADLLAAAKTLPAPNREMEHAARARLDRLTKPQGSLGRLEDIVAWTCGWQDTLTPCVERAYTLVFAANHGVAHQGVSAYPQAVTAQMVANFISGGAAINQLCRAIPSTLRVVPLRLETPTQDFTQAPAMSMEECLAAFSAGMEAVPSDAQIVILGEMGIANTTVAAALANALAGGNAADWVGAGTGVRAETLQRKREAVANAVTLHRAACGAPLRLLAHLGGRELAAMAGAAMAARLRRVPVLLDGYVASAAVAPLLLAAPDALEHCLAGHVSAEPGHRKLLEWMRMQPLLDLGMRLGEGSGAQLALGLVRAALATFSGMATFESAQVAIRCE